MDSLPAEYLKFELRPFESREKMDLDLVKIILAKLKIRSSIMAAY